MKRTLLIARREFVAYAKTVGFWLSLLAFPMFAVLGGGIPLLIRSAELDLDAPDWGQVPKA